MTSSAIFLDRDGVINKLIYYPDQGIIDSPFTVEQFELYPGVGQAIRQIHEMGYVVVLVSNQPGIAKGHFSWETFARIRMKMLDGLAKEKAFIDREYYCFHHPDAIRPYLQTKCECRKPEPGMILEATHDLGLDLLHSIMIGDGLTDIQAGKKAGCRTILLGKAKCDLCWIMDELCTRPDIIKADLVEAVAYLKNERVHSELIKTG